MAVSAHDRRSVITLGVGEMALWLGPLNVLCMVVQLGGYGPIGERTFLEEICHLEQAMKIYCSIFLPFPFLFVSWVWIQCYQLPLSPA